VQSENTISSTIIKYHKTVRSSIKQLSSIYLKFQSRLKCNPRASIVDEIYCIHFISSIVYPNFSCILFLSPVSLPAVTVNRNLYRTVALTVLSTVLYLSCKGQLITRPELDSRCPSPVLATTHEQRNTIGIDYLVEKTVDC